MTEASIKKITAFDSGIIAEYYVIFSRYTKLVAAQYSKIVYFEDVKKNV